MQWKGSMEPVSPYKYRIPKGYKPSMQTDGIIYANDALYRTLLSDQAPEQVVNVAMLPGIVGSSMAMPDIHWGYGFPIGGVAAFDAAEGLISPGGVGYDINCGVRVLRTDLDISDVKDKIGALVDALFHNIPSGLGSKGRVHVNHAQLEDVLTNGAQWAVENGYGWNEDLEFLEENGHFDGADPSKVSDKAKKRGLPQLGSLGAGNHFLEIQKVAEVFDPEAAKIMGFDTKDQIAVMIHTGSRGCGYQICDDQIYEMSRNFKKDGPKFVSETFGFQLPDRQLVCAPMDSKEAQNYMGAMKCAANYAWTNRQMILHWVRESFEKVMGKSADELGMHVVYDVAHNIAKEEEHEVDGKKRKLIVHRKGATRSFGPGHSDVPSKYQSIGQPVLIPGDMGTQSYILAGTQTAMEETFGSTCHGAGRVMSRAQAKRSWRGSSVISDLKRSGIIVKAASDHVAAEEAPAAYKDVSQVVETCHGAGISKMVVKLVPLGVVKG